MKNPYADQRHPAHDAIVKALRAQGATVHALDLGPVDLLIGYRGRTFLANVGLRGDRQRWAREWHGAVHTVTTPAEAVGILLGRIYPEPRDAA